MNNQRVVALEGVHNFRDYGGYPIAGGGRMRSGLLYRSGQHVGASDADLAVIATLDLRHVIDFRGESERQNYPCRRADGFCAEIIAYEGETANLAPHIEAAGGVLTREGAHRAMERIYRNLPNRQPVLWVMRRYFATLARGEGASLVHCLAGKDRTGMAVALLHHALGVHPDDAMEDFLLTNVAGNIEARIAAGGETIRAKYGAVDDETIRILMGVDARYLHAMRKAVEEAHGSLDAFLADVLEVDEARREALRLHLVES
ncbi:tyrosine-protein phosphatase [Pelagerythrobacter rhizovicinus]|uniref:Tyrosine-protein phosphatase n=1 Tax=Pelagerythrobacter rhizovicinus TaxID=2268576 RepID=A0A4Q2KNJ8_9SPHN|nr:tyrosine-protein phosphatase [Pelagerythrobacter rhizovicinus]RXZ65900.1 tyrosine-protein phosphatase [Pelagerythrobacter rhizovicinus]